MVHCVCPRARYVCGYLTRIVLDHSTGHWCLGHACHRLSSSVRRRSPLHLYLVSLLHLSPSLVRFPPLFTPTHHQPFLFLHNHHISSPSNVDTLGFAHSQTRHHRRPHHCCGIPSHCQPHRLQVRVRTPAPRCLASAPPPATRPPFPPHPRRRSPRRPPHRRSPSPPTRSPPYASTRRISPRSRRRSMTLSRRCVSWESVVVMGCAGSAWQRVGLQ